MFIFNKKVNAFPDVTFSGKELTNYYCPDLMESATSKYTFTRSEDKGSTIDVLFDDNGKTLKVTYRKDSNKYVLSSVSYQ